jgi:hypothetical protein
VIPDGERVVSQEEQQHVEIYSGWLIEQFAKYVLGRGPHVPLTTMMEQFPVPDHCHPENMSAFHVDHIQLTAEFTEALRRFDALVVQKDFQYQSSWQRLGPLIPLADDIDKLARLQGAWKSGALASWDPDKQRGILFDLIVRSFQILCWMDTQFQDDDDDRQPRQVS